MVLSKSEIRLENQKYVSIDQSYGGNQEWFRDHHYGVDDSIYYGGCGLISLADLLLYFERNQATKKIGLPVTGMSEKIELNAYQEFVRGLFTEYLKPLKRPFFRPQKFTQAADFVLGIQGWQFKLGLKKAMKDFGLDKTEVEFLSLRKNRAEIAHMIQVQLSQNIPVPLLIAPTKEMFPKALSFLGRKKTVPSYLQIAGDVFDSQATNLSSHWVTITGYVYSEIFQEEYVLLSSWGELYQMRLADFLMDNDYLSGIITIT